MLTELLVPSNVDLTFCSNTNHDIFKEQLYFPRIERLLTGLWINNTAEIFSQGVSMPSLF